MIEINDTRYYSIDEFPNYIRVDKKPLNKKGKEQLIDFLKQKKSGYFYSEGVINAVIVENQKSEYSQISKQSLIQGMINIYPRYITEKKHPFLEIYIVDGRVNSRTANHKTRILIDDVWTFYKTLNLRNFELFGHHFSMIKDNILPRINSGREIELPEVDLYFSKSTIEDTCKALRLFVDLDQHLFNEAVISERSKEIMENKGVLTKRPNPNRLTNFDSMDKCYFLQFQRFLKETKPIYNKDYINVGTAIIHLIDQTQRSLSNDGFMYSLRANSLLIANAILDKKINIFNAITKNSIKVEEAKKTYDEISVTHPEGFQSLLFMNLNIKQLVCFLEEEEKINDDRLLFFKNLLRGVFPLPINKFKDNNIILLSDASKLYERLETHTKILVDCVKLYFEKHESINQYPQFKEIYNSLKNKEIKHINIKSVGLKEIIFVMVKYFRRHF